MISKRSLINPGWATIVQLCDKLSKRLKVRDRTQFYKGIVAVTRGGLVPSAIIAQRLGVTLVDTICITSYHEDSSQTEELKCHKKIHPNLVNPDKGAHLLVVDDICDTGATFKYIREILPDATYCAIYCKPKGLNQCDVYSAFVEQHIWVNFPWELPVSIHTPKPRSGTNLLS